MQIQDVTELLEKNIKYQPHKYNEVHAIDGNSLCASSQKQIKFELACFEVWE